MNSYFSHDSNARNDEKIALLRMKHGSAGYGVYFMILERLREAKDYMSVKDYNLIAFDLREDSQLIKSVVEEFGLFTFVNDKNRGECFYSKSFNDRMKLKDEKSQRRAEAGKKGAAKRWGSKDKAEPSNNDSNAMAKPSEKIASKEKESKVNKSKVNKTNNNNVVGMEPPTPDLKSITLWEQLWGFPNAIAQQDLGEWIKKFGDEMVTWAIRYAGTRDVKAKAADRYLDTVFRGWEKQNIKTIEQAEQQSEQHRQQMSSEYGGRHQSKGQVRESTPDWAQDGYQHEHKPVDQGTVDEVKAQMARLKQEQAQEA